jgi:hypothetical protein
MRLATVVGFPVAALAIVVSPSAGQAATVALDRPSHAPGESMTPHRPPTRLRRRRRVIAGLATAIAVLFPAVTSAATFTVTTTADTGAGSLRQAIIDSNNSAEAGRQNVIQFAIPSPVAPITPATDLPVIFGGVLIDASPNQAPRPTRTPKASTPCSRSC